MLTIQPAPENVVLKMLEDDGEKKTSGGIILAGEKNPISMAQVVSVAYDEKWLKKGDLVLIRKANAVQALPEYPNLRLALTTAVCAKIVEENSDEQSEEV